MNVHWPIVRTLTKRPSHTAVIDDQREWTGGQLLGGAFHLADVLSGVSRSQTVALLLPTGGVFPMAAMATWMLGKTVVPVNYLLGAEELQYIVDDCEADVVVSVRPMLRHLGFEPAVRELVAVDELAFGGLPSPRWPACSRSEDLAALLYTSGTSGRPKGVMLTHGNVESNVRQARQRFKLTREDVVLGVLPQFHSFGFTVKTLLPLTVGARTVYSARFIPQQIVRLIRRHRPTLFVGIPSMYRALLSVKSATREDFACLRAAVSGGEALPASVADAFEERFGVRISEGYGLTETAPATNVCLNDDYRAGSVGRALRGIQTRIVDPETGMDLGPGRDGEIRFRGPNIMRGYFKLPAETAETFDERGYFRTGDIGRLDEDGHLYITGRLKEMLIVGGENVFPREIEEVLDQHPSVHASAVIGVADEVRGELPWAFVELNEGAEFDEAALRTWCRARLAGYKVPRQIEVLDRLPRNATGKILRRELKPRAQAGGGV